MEFIMTTSIISSYIAPQQFIQALPPQYQTALEIAAIENHPEFQKKIGDKPYEIRTTGQGKYSIVTSGYTVQVDVIYVPPEVPICGPAHFELKFHDALEIFPTITD